MKKNYFIAFLFFGLMNAAVAQTTNYQVHSLFVVNIAKYSTWPETSTEFRITVFGKSKIYDELVKNTSGKNINGLTVKVDVVENVSEIQSPHIVFIADGKSGSMNDVVKATDGKSVLIIAEREGLYKKGASFSFVLMDNNTLRYDINNNELEKRHIRISKNLASLANTVM